jgi:hypothetical protein
MSPATKMLSVTTPLMSKARQPASQPTPADHPAERADERRVGAFSDGHLEFKLPTDRSHLRADEAGADDQHPLWLGGQRLLQCFRVIGGPYREEALQLGLLLVEPRSRAHAGGDEHTVVRD